MLNHEDLIKSPEYLLEIIQNEIYRQVDNYMKNENINNEQLAKRLGVSKRVVSDVLNGNFNPKLKNLIKLSTSIDLILKIQFIK